MKWLTFTQRKRISRKTFVRGQNATASLETEIETLKRLQHPHLVQFVGYVSWLL